MNKAVIAFRSVEIDVDGFADCTKRGAQSATKLYNQEAVQGTRVCGINYCFLLYEICMQSLCCMTYITDRMYSLFCNTFHKKIFSNYLQYSMRYAIINARLIPPC